MGPSNWVRPLGVYLCPLPYPAIVMVLKVLAKTVVPLVN
jgi:hypothetical protein